MTLRAPHQPSRALGLAAGRLAASRAGLAAYATFAGILTIAAVVERPESPQSAQTAATEAGAPARPVVASLDPNFQAMFAGRAESRMADLAPRPPGAASDTPMRIEAAPTLLSAPRPPDSEIEPGADAFHRDAEAVAPQQPQLILSARAPDWTGLDAVFRPRMPEAGPVALSPVGLPQTVNPDAAPRVQIREQSARSFSAAAMGGESIDYMLVEAGASDDDRIATLTAFKADSIGQTLRAGDRIDIAFAPRDEGEGERIVGVRLRLAQGRSTELRWDDQKRDLWSAIDAREQRQARLDRAKETRRPFGDAIGEPPLEHEDSGRILISGTIQSTLAQAADDADLTRGEAKTLTDIFRHLVDFERDLRKGDRFEVMFQRRPNGDYGPILYTKLWNNGREIALYRGRKSDGTYGYFDADGRTNKRSIMRTPIRGGSISSGYGMRLHPILGYNKMHKGVDFAAPTGTPILAAGDGVVEYVGWRGSYGRYIRLRHSNGYKTAYAHMSRFKKGLKSGQRIGQGEVIGYVGSTGRSTGPHLHFEVLRDKKQINPTKVADFGAKKGLKGQALADFKREIAKIERVIAELRGGSRVAQAE